MMVYFILDFPRFPAQLRYFTPRLREYTNVRQIPKSLLPRIRTFYRRFTQGKNAKPKNRNSENKNDRIVGHDRNLSHHELPPGYPFMVLKRSRFIQVTEKYG
jgi:hypothetical protein